MLVTALRITLILAAALAVMPLLRRRSAALRAWILISALAAITVLPLLQVVAPVWGTPIDTATMMSGTAQWSRAALAIWGIGVVVHLFVLGSGILRLMGVAAAADAIQDGRCADLALEVTAEYRVHAPVQLLEAGQATLPVTWGHTQPKILLPPDARGWSDERIRAVLCHEIAHVRRRDWLVRVATLLVRSVYWPHPLVWAVCGRWQLEAERACDDAVLRQGIDPARYAAHLVDLARTFIAARQPAHATALLGRSTLERRVRSMLAPRTDHSTVRASVAGAVTLVTLAATGAIAGFGTTIEETTRELSAPPRRLTLLLDGRIMDLSKEWPTYPNPRAGLVEGPGLPQGF